MPRFSANLGFLWKELPLPAAIRAAKNAGFEAVECHWPYDTPAAETKIALLDTGLPMLGLNTVRGGDGEFGLAALPGWEEEAHAAIDQALEYAAEVGAGAVHVMAGIATGELAGKAYRANLAYACGQAAPHGITILIEPINTLDVPGFFLTTPDQALAVIEALALPNLKLMFDCYHVAKMGLNVIEEFNRAMPHIGHIQFAGVPDRAEPDQGTLDYRAIFRHLEEIGYSGPLGAEYKPTGGGGGRLDWMQTLTL